VLGGVQGKLASLGLEGMLSGFNWSENRQAGQALSVIATR
jgi:hypothetical protein